MGILELFLFLALIGFAAWFLTGYPPVASKITGGVRTVIQVAAVVITIIIVLNAFGLLGNISLGNVPRVR
jgi:hypothetical protein